MPRGVYDRSKAAPWGSKTRKHREVISTAVRIQEEARLRAVADLLPGKASKLVAARAVPATRDGGDSQYFIYGPPRGPGQSVPPPKDSILGRIDEATAYLNLKDVDALCEPISGLATTPRGIAREGYLESLLQLHEWCSLNRRPFIVVMQMLIDEFLHRPKKPSDE